MNNFIANITSPGARKYLYRVTWAVLLVLVSSGKLDESQLNAVLGVVAAILAVADSQTAPDTSVVSVATALKIEDTLTGREDVEPAAEIAPQPGVYAAPVHGDVWQPPSDLDWEPPTA